MGYDDEYQSLDRRNWEAPRDANGLAALLRVFGALADTCAGTGSSVAQCPSWFDDCAHEIREAVSVGGHMADVACYWWDPRLPAERETPPPAGTRLDLLSWLSSLPEAVSTPVLREQRRRDAIYRAAGDFPGGEGGPEGGLARSLLHAIGPGGALSRDVVEAVLHPLESEEILSFARVPSGPESFRDLLTVSHTNGDTDIAYGLSGNGDLLLWPDLASGDAVKDGGLPHAPDPADAIRVGAASPEAAPAM